MNYSIVIPMYNEHTRGSGTSRDLLNRLNQLREQLDIGQYEVIIVDDCSNDDTRIFCESYISCRNLKNWKCFSLPVNGGKGAAIIAGVEVTKYDNIIIMDADLSVTLETVNEICKKHELHYGECIIGNRVDDESVITNERTLPRILVSCISHSLIYHVGRVKVEDSQCGFKMFKKRDYDKIKHVLKGYRWLFDVELIYALSCIDVAPISVPVVWDNMEKESTLQLKNALKKSFMDFVDFLSNKGKVKKQLKLIR